MLSKLFNDINIDKPLIKKHDSVIKITITDVVQINKIIINANTNNNKNINENKYDYRELIKIKNKYEEKLNLLNEMLFINYNRDFKYINMINDNLEKIKNIDNYYYTWLRNIFEKEKDNNSIYVNEHEKILTNSRYIQTLYEKIMFYAYQKCTSTNVLINKIKDTKILISNLSRIIKKTINVNNNY